MSRFHILSALASRQRRRTLPAALGGSVVTFGAGNVTFNAVDVTYGEGVPASDWVDVATSFTEDSLTDFLNPERGWMIREDYRASAFTNARGSQDTDNPTGYTVNWNHLGSWSPLPWDGSGGNPFRWDNYLTSDLPANLLEALTDAFTATRTAGIKMKVRFTYNYGSSGTDTTIAWMTRHMEQVAPILEANKDVIASMDAGLVGAWGEWHSSSSGHNAWNSSGVTARGQIIDMLLANIPVEISIGMRYPIHIREKFGDPGYDMDIANRFNGSDQARMGWFIDCLWTDQTNTGTYSYDQGTARGDLDKLTFAKIGRYAATSGESCDNAGLTSYSEGATVMAEMDQQGGPDTLFRKFWEDMYDRWKTTWFDEANNVTHYDEITKRLGYRLVLNSVTLPDGVTPGAAFNASLQFTNRGYGKVYNKRPIDLEFDGPTGIHTVRLSEDARKDFPLARSTTTSTYSVVAPAGLQAGGTYAVHLALPDPHSNIASDPRYAIRLANTDVTWNGTTGRNELGITMQVG